MKRGVVISDTHCGSFYGLLPPGFVTFEGVEKIINPGQQYLWECWLDFANRVEAFEPHFVIVNGDVIDGLQFKSHGAELSLHNWKDQRDAAIKTLKVLRSVTRKAKWYFTQGTPYHTGHFGEAEEDIAEAMAGVPYSSFGTGKLCREVLKLEVESGFHLLAAHHVSLASVYTTTPLLKESRASRGAEQLHIRSHGHHCTEVMEDGVRTVMSPCWQLQTRYARKGGPQRLIPDIGGLFIEINQGRSTVWPKLYSVPPLPVTKL